MNTYYVGGFPITDELYHHGIKGQKWGIRRYQNEDGSLTAAGKERYGSGLGERAQGKQGFFRKHATGDWVLGQKRIGDRLEERYKRKSEEAKNQGRAKEAKNYSEMYKAQKAKNIDRDKYISNASTGKLIAQQLLMGEIGANAYRVARQNQATRIEALASGIASNIPYVAIPATIGISAYQDKKRYGKVGLL